MKRVQVTINEEEREIILSALRDKERIISALPPTSRLNVELAKVQLLYSRLSR